MSQVTAIHFDDGLLAPIADEVGPFRRIADGFSTPDGAWVGAVIASPLAIYLLKAREQVVDRNLVELARLLATDRIDPVRTCSVRELPKPIRNVLDPWGYEPNRDVIVLPRSAVSRVRWVAWAWMDARIKVFCGGDEFCLTKATLSRGNKRFMLDHGWSLNADLTPTNAPIHGESLGLPADSMPRRRSVGRRLWYLLLALLALGFTLWAHFGLWLFRR